MRLRPFLPPDDMPVVAPAVDERLAALVRLLTFERSLPTGVARSAFAPASLEQLESAGLVTVDGGQVVANYRLVAYDGLLLAADRARPADREVVMAFTPPSLLLARLTPRGSCRSMFDLGTGSGVLALLGARHCERVTAVDVSTRALMFARFNAALNRADRVELLEGSWFAPVAGRRFELIVGNPPFAVSPDHDLTYRDSGLPGGALLEALCRSAGEHLEEGGLAILLASWPHASKEDWAATPTAWVKDGGCDALVLCHETREPLDHAVRWNTPPVRFLEPEALRETVARWVRHCRETGAGAISFGTVVLRRRTGGAPRVSALRASTLPGDRAAEQLIALLAGQDLLRTLGEDERALLGRSFSLPEGTSISQRFQRRDARFAARPAVIELEGGLGVRAAVDPDALEVLFACGQQLSLAEVVERVSDRRGIDRDELARIALAAARELLAHGLLYA